MIDLFSVCTFGKTNGDHEFFSPPCLLSLSHLLSRLFRNGVNQNINSVFLCVCYLNRLALSRGVVWTMPQEHNNKAKFEEASQCKNGPISRVCFSTPLGDLEMKFCPTGIHTLHRLSRNDSDFSPDIWFACFIWWNVSMLLFYGVFFLSSNEGPKYQWSKLKDHQKCTHTCWIVLTGWKLFLDNQVQGS